jgi:hypothetical protein
VLGRGVRDRDGAEAGAEEQHRPAPCARAPPRAHGAPL